MSPKTLEELIELAAETLPEGWMTEVHAESCSGFVKAIRPDQTEVIMDDGESDITEQFRNAMILADEETKADTL